MCLRGQTSLWLHPDKLPISIALSQSDFFGRLGHRRYSNLSSHHPKGRQSRHNQLSLSPSSRTPRICPAGRVRVGIGCTDTRPPGRTSPRTRRRRTLFVRSASEHRARIWVRPRIRFLPHKKELQLLMGAARILHSFICILFKVDSPIQ